MIDYGKPDRQRFLRHLKLLALLRGAYVAILGMCIGGTLGAIFNLFSRGTP